MEDIPPRWVEDLPLDVDHGEVPVAVPDNILQAPLSTGQKSSERSSETRTASLQVKIRIRLFNKRDGSETPG